MGLSRHGAVSCGGATRLVRAADGWLAVALSREDDIDAVPAWLELDGATTDVWSAVATVAAKRTLGYLEARGVLLGLPVAALSTVEPTVDSGLPVVVTPYGPSTRNERPPLVVDLSSLWAGPLCSHLLQRNGARVIKVESEDRPDTARAGAPEFFDLLNNGKQSVVVDLRTIDGRGSLRRLLLAADVVVEASRPRALEQLGVIVDEVMRHESGPDVWVSITGHGRNGDGPTGSRSAMMRPSRAASSCTTNAVRASAPTRSLIRSAAWWRPPPRSTCCNTVGSDRWSASAMAHVARHFAGPTLDVTEPSVSAAPPQARAPAGKASSFGCDARAVLEQLAAA